MRPRKIVSGGQTGVDRAALDVALEQGFPCGGWCPKGRLAEDGALDARYPLEETPSPSYPERTEWNVRDTDGTLVLTRGTPDRGTLLTLHFAQRMAKPALSIVLRAGRSVATVRKWLDENAIDVLNVAGPRESRAPGIQAAAAVFLRELLRRTGGAADKTTPPQ